MITSMITMIDIVKSNPAGFTPIVPNNGGASAYIASQLIDREYDYTDLTFTTDDIPQTQEDFLTMVKTDLDTNWAPTVFTDSAVNYTLEYSVKSVKLDFNTVGTTSDRSIWTEREYMWFVKVQVKSNID